jgi:hypothetical protein
MTALLYQVSDLETKLDWGERRMKKQAHILTQATIKAGHNRLPRQFARLLAETWQRIADKERHYYSHVVAE